MTETITIIVTTFLSVAIFTLIERNIIGNTHTRNGPNKTSFNGILQPFSDATNLLSNEWININNTNNLIFILSPAVGLIIYTTAWIAVPNDSSLTNINLSIITFLAILSLTIIFSISTGWSSNSKYTILGSYRATAQAISYEVSLSIIVLAMLVLAETIATETFNEKSTIVILTAIITIPVWIVILLAETGRTPFDFTESESELVSGFNTEFYGTLFSIFFIAEYQALLVIATISITIVLPCSTGISAALACLVLILTTVIRITLPRIRYDNLITVAWLSAIPIAVALLYVLSMI